MNRGLSGKTSVGRAGSYRDRGYTETLLLPTVVARGVDFWTAGERALPLGGLATSPSYSRSQPSASWTGRSFLYKTDRNVVEVQLRSTIPGPLFRTFGRKMNIRFEYGNNPRSAVDLEKGEDISVFTGKNRGRVILLLPGRSPHLIVSSSVIKEWDALTHEHLELTFADAGAKVMWVQLLSDADIPRGEQVKRWIELVQRPPIHCDEEYEVVGDRVHIRQNFTDADGRPSAFAPIPPFTALLGKEGGLQKVPAGKKLLDTLIGPYCMVEGSSWSGSIDMAWRRAKVVATRPVEGPLTPIPEELSYSGDMSWDPKHVPMDALIEMTTWAPLANIAPPKLWKQVRSRLRVPSVNEFKRSLVTVKENAINRVYAKPAGVFAECHDASYDIDWYNGKTLAGIRRAIDCTDPTISRPAENLARHTKQERRLLQAYMEIYHDWAMNVDWTDPRGENWDLDCSHLGLGGILAEEYMCRREGDTEGADFSLYLAAKMATAFMAAYPAADWMRSHGFVYHDKGGMHVGLTTMREWRGGLISTLDCDRHYGLAPDLPEFNALIKYHGPVERWRKAADAWRNEFPKRYADWEYYFKGSYGSRFKRSGSHEDRTQTAVHYMLAPEVYLRLWTLDEDPDMVEALWKTPIDLSVLLWLRSGSKLVKG